MTRALSSTYQPFTLISSASLGIFRVLFGGVMCFSLLRFILSGWVEELWIRPDFFFKYAGATWMPVWEPTGLYLHVSLTLLGAVGVMLGLYFRYALFMFVIGFTGLQLMDQVNYLNHYYLVICLTIPLALSPAGCVFSLDCWWRKVPIQSKIARWSVDLIRFQVALVYIFAAIAKVGEDWLMYGQPLSIWLSARGDLPLIGFILTKPLTAILMSWTGFLYDLLIVPALLWRKSRRFAYILVIGFHSMTWLLFDIGIFPILMTLATPIFFAPSWPLRILSLFKLGLNDAQKASQSTDLKLAFSTSTKMFLALWCSFHILFPLRGFVLDENVLWSERGMRYSWRVMVREKMGSLTYRVKSTESGRQWEVNPKVYLTARQLSEISGQPDMIIQLSHWVKQRFEARLGKPVEVFADVWVSLNGRPPQRLLNPNVDLTRVTANDPQVVLPPPITPPLSPWGKMSLSKEYNR
ncbi:MAG: gamma carboxylase [Myxococcales bacterium]|nr:gamma carboxylase [Myxococcales bacterium]